MPVAEQDIERIGVLRKVSASFEEPPEGYEPILHIRIPVDVDISDLRERGIVGIHYNGKPEIIDKDTKIDVDDKLMQFLSRPFPTQKGDWAYLRFDGAQLDCSARMLVTFHDDLLEKMLTELGFDRKLSKSDVLKRKKAKLYLIKLIELHDSDFHLKTLIDPRTKTADAMYYPQMCEFMKILGAPVLPLSLYWHELWAIVNEMKFLDGVKDEISEFVKRKVEDVRRKTSSGGGVSYSMIYEIIRFFQSKGLTLNDMIKILEVPIKAFVYPELWLCCVLLDLAEGHIKPTEIPDKSIYYDFGDAEYDDLAERMEWVREGMFSNISYHHHSIYEKVVIGKDAIERKWFCLKPKLDIVEFVLKSQILLQKSMSDVNFVRKIIPTTLNSTSYVWFEYQERGLSIEDLFRNAMKRKISHEKLEQLFTIWINPNSIRPITDIEELYDFVRTLRMTFGFKDYYDFMMWQFSREIKEGIIKEIQMPNEDDAIRFVKNLKSRFQAFKKLHDNTS